MTRLTYNFYFRNAVRGVPFYLHMWGKKAANDDTF